MSSLTVPQAPTTAGRTAASITPKDPRADIVAEASQQVFQIGTRLENDRLERQMGRLQVDLEKDINDLRLEAEAIGDPDELTAFWDERTQSLRDTYLSGTSSDGRARVDRKNAERFGLAFDSVVNRHGFTIGSRALAARQSQHSANFMAWEAETAPMRARGTPDEVAAIDADFEDWLEREVASNRLTPEQAEARRQSHYSEGASARATTMLAENPEALISGLEAGEFDSLGAERVAQLRVRGNAAIAAREKEAATERDQAEADRVAAVNTDASSAIKLARAGRTSALEDEILADEGFALAKPEVVAELRGIAALRDNKFAIDTMTLDELRELEARLLTEDITRDWQNEALDAVRSQIEADQDGFSADPMAHAAAKGLPGYNLEAPENLLEDADATRAFFETAARRSSELVEGGYTDRAMPLTADQLTQLKETISENGDPRARAELAATVAETFGPEVMANMGLDPTFSWVAGLSANGGDASIATGIMRGQNEMRLGNVVMPSENDRKGAFFGQVDTLFESMPGGSVIKGQIRGAADALYASRNSVNPDGTLDEEAYAQALHEVLGGRGSYGSRDATGGLAEVNGFMTALPSAVSPRQVEDAIDLLSVDQIEVAHDDDSRMFNHIFNESQKRVIEDILPNMPDGAEVKLLVNGRPMAPTDWSELIFAPNGSDSYTMVASVGGRPVSVVNQATGEPVNISMTMLVRAAEAERRRLRIQAREEASKEEIGSISDAVGIAP